MSDNPMDMHIKQSADHIVRAIEICRRNNVPVDVDILSPFLTALYQMAQWHTRDGQIKRIDREIKKLHTKPDSRSMRQLLNSHNPVDRDVAMESM